MLMSVRGMIVGRGVLRGIRVWLFGRWRERRISPSWGEGDGTGAGEEMEMEMP